MLSKVQLSTPQALSARAQEEVASPAPIEPTAEATAIELPTPPPPEPAATDIPLATAIPTPVTTPLPVSAPPYIEGIEALQPQPFWMYWAQGDEIWRIDNQGQTAELVVDAFVATGSHLLGPAKEGEGTDCCISTPYFTIVPDQQKLALVTIDQEKIDAAPKTPPNGSATTIRLYDMNGTSLPLGSGTRLLWSPDSKQVAFLRDGGLWIANLETGEVSERIKPQPGEGTWIGEYAWSPDSAQLAFMYEQGFFQPIPTIWVLNLLENNQPKAVVTKDNPIMNLKWDPDGKSVYYVSSEGAKDFYPFHQVQNLWKVSLLDGTAQPVTVDMWVSHYGFLPGQPWLYLSDFRLYESALDTVGYHDA